MGIGALILLAVVMLVRELTFQYERREAARERQDLLQRIQAPETAIASYAREEAPPVSGLAPLMDDEYESLFQRGD
jgi:hypothetical protein